MNLLDSEIKRISDWIVKQDCESLSIINSLAAIYFQIYYGKHYSASNSYNAGIRRLKDIVDKLAIDQPVKHYSLSNGIIGVGFIINLLNKDGSLDCKNYYETEYLLSDFALAIGELCVKQNNLDYLYGALGIAQYFNISQHNKKRDYFFKLCLSRIDELATDNEYGLLFAAAGTENGKFNLGMPHGLVSILKFLSLCYFHNIQRDVCLNLIFKGISSLRNIYIEIGGFPTIYDFSAKRNTISNLAWCYGDLVVGYTLYQIGRLLNDNKTTFWAESILINCASRPDFDITDIFVCHGTAGIAYIFNKLDKVYQIKEVRDAANLYINRTLKATSQIQQFSDYKGAQEDRTHDINLGLLNGFVGINLVYTSFLSNIFYWDSILFIDAYE